MQRKFLAGALLAIGVPLAVAAAPISQPVQASEGPIIVGLDADMSGSAGQSGLAIQRGAEFAIAEINRQGGVLGRTLELLVKDHRGNPARGRDNIESFAAVGDLVAVIGGINTPVALSELAAIHQHEIVYLGAWAAGTTIVENGFAPNYVFRVSVRDEYAGGFLLRAAAARGHRRPGLLLEQTGWGRSNEKAFVEAAEELGITIAGIEWFNRSVADMTPQIARLKAAGADVVMLVSAPDEGVTAVHAMAGFAPTDRLPIISHWGITGGDFPSMAAESLRQVDLVFLQTYSFLNPTRPERATAFLSGFMALYPDIRSARDIRSPVGTAHAYELVHLLAEAIERAGTADRPSVRNALESLPRYKGLIRDYLPPFSAAHHDALGGSDFTLARFDSDGAIVPVAR